MSKIKSFIKKLDSVDVVLMFAMCLYLTFFFINISKLLF